MGTVSTIRSAKAVRARSQTAIMRSASTGAAPIDWRYRLARATALSSRTSSQELLRRSPIRNPSRAVLSL